MDAKEHGKLNEWIEKNEKAILTDNIYTWFVPSLELKLIIAKLSDSGCYCTKDAICEICMIDEYEKTGIDPDHEQEIFDEQNALSKGNA